MRFQMSLPVSSLHLLSSASITFVTTIQSCIVIVLPSGFVSTDAYPCAFSAAVVEDMLNDNLFLARTS